MEDTIKAIIDAKYDRAVKRVVWLARRTKAEGLLGDCVPYKTVWDCWKRELQEDYSPYHRALEETMDVIIEGIVDQLPHEDGVLMSMDTDYYRRLDEEPKEPVFDTPAVAQELSKRVNQLASNEPPRREVRAFLDDYGERLAAEDRYLTDVMYSTPPSANDARPAHPSDPRQDESLTSQNAQPANQAALTILQKLGKEGGSTLHLLALALEGLDREDIPLDPKEQSRLEQLIGELLAMPPHNAMALIFPDAGEQEDESQDLLNRTPLDAVAALLEFLILQFSLRS